MTYLPSFLLSGKPGLVHYATFNQFTEAILGFFRQTLPDNWQEFRDTVSDN
jgi:hypothetical protein